MSFPDLQSASIANEGGAASQSTPTADSSSRVAAPAYLSAAWWQQHWQEIDKRIYECIGIWINQWWPPERDAITEAIGDVFREERHYQHEAIAKIKDRVLVLETTNSFEERFNKLADGVKHGTEIPQSELLAKIETLQRQLDELKKVAAQPGPQGPPGKLSSVQEYLAGRVHYEADVVTHADALWQARCDTVHAPPHSDWICLALAGRNGADGCSPNVCGTYNACEKYERLDIVALDGAAFIARRDNPGSCPGDDWQLLSRQGRPGRRGERGERGPRGEKGEKGESGAAVVSWQLDPERYRISPLMSDGEVGPMLELRPLFERYHEEVDR
jgi:hypothetical protein